MGPATQWQGKARGNRTASKKYAKALAIGLNLAARHICEIAPRGHIADHIWYARSKVDLCLHEWVFGLKKWIIRK